MSAPSISAWSPSTGFDSYAGGMIGLNIGTVSNCHTRGGSVLGRQHVGGLVGTNHKIVEYSSSTANVSGDCWVGGVVGYSAQNCTLRYCYSSGSISAAASGARRFRIGGITGIVEGVNTKIEYCYSSASVTGKSHIGGAIGSVSSATIKHCYSRGSVSGASSEMGGFVGYIQSGAGFTQCFWDANTSGRSTSAGGTSRTTAQMKVTSNFTGWDFMCETANGTADIWVHRSAVNNGYPTGMGRRLFRHLQRLAGYKQQQLGTK